MTAVSFTPDDVDALRHAELALCAQGDHQAALTVARLADRMFQARQDFIAQQVIDELTERRGRIRVVDGGAA